MVFPELSISGYTCADLFGQQSLLDECEEALIALAEEFAKIDSLLFVGAPLRHKGSLYNCAVAICKGRILAAIPKIHIPEYGEFYERRWFASGADIKSSTIRLRDYPSARKAAIEIPFGTDILIRHFNTLIGCEICEDLWVPEPPSGRLALEGATVIVNLSASDEVLGKHHYLKELIKQQSARCRCAYVYAGAGRGESSTDLVFAGNAMVAEDGNMLAETPRFAFDASLAKTDVDIDSLTHDRLHSTTFSGDNTLGAGCKCCRTDITIIDTDIRSTDDSHYVELLREINPYPFVPASDADRKASCMEIINIQCAGLAQRLDKIKCSNIVVGISGGLDSTLALLVACRTFDMLQLPRTGIHAITMPGLATTSHTRTNAEDLMEELDVDSLCMPIGDLVACHFKDIGQDPHNYDATYENSQARARTMILMDYANKVGGIVLGTGDLSELALGWATYNGDHMSMYGINASIPKTLVRYLIQWFADETDSERLHSTLQSIIDTPISPELIPAQEDEDEDQIAQKTEELVGPYELHDFFLYQILRHGFTPDKIKELAHKAFADKYETWVIDRWLGNFYRRFCSQQFKRSCMPDGPKVGSVCLSPRGGWRMPSGIDNIFC